MKTAKETIIEEFLKLLNEKSFEELTVKEIVQKARISRSTFYLHFADKYALMEEVRRELNDRFLSFYQHGQSNWEKPTPRRLCEHIIKYRSFYEVEFEDSYATRKLSNNLTVHLMQAFGDPDYAIFASYGTIGYLSFWVKDGFTISPGEAAEKLLKIGLTNWSEKLGIETRFLLS